jgi:hypothetical protein
MSCINVLSGPQQSFQVEEPGIGLGSIPKSNRCAVSPKGGHLWLEACQGPGGHSVGL